MAYLDTSILGSYYCPETLSAAVNQALMSISNPIISPLVEVEFVSLLSLKVRNRDIDTTFANRIYRQFQRHRAEHLYRVVDIGTREYSASRRLLGKFNSALRTVDAIHLAVATLYRHQIWTTDKPFADSARKLNIPCFLIRA